LEDGVGQKDEKKSKTTRLQDLKIRDGLTNRKRKRIQLSFNANVGKYGVKVTEGPKHAII